jgi:hypothetical protein
MATLQWRRLGFPGADGALPARAEVGQTCAVGGGIGTIEVAQSRIQRLGDRQYAVRVELHVRVALRVHVAGGTVERGGLVERHHLLGGHEIAGTRRHLAVTGLADQLRQPAGLELGAGAHHQIGTPHLGDQTGFGLDLMDVLQRAGRHIDRDQITRQFLGQCTPFGLTGEHIQGLRRRRDHGAQQQRYREQTRHVDS